MVTRLSLQITILSTTSEITNCLLLGFRWGQTKSSELKGDCIKRYHSKRFGSLLNGSNIGLSGSLEQREASHKIFTNKPQAYLFRRGVFVVKKLIYSTVNIKAKPFAEISHCTGLHCKWNLSGAKVYFVKQFSARVVPVAMFTRPWSWRRLTSDVIIMNIKLEWTRESFHRSRFLFF